MKIKKILSLGFAVLAALLAVLTLKLCLDAISADPVLVTAPSAAVETADAMMTAVCAGDYETASGLMHGTPDLGVDRDPADEVGVILWDAFRESLAYELTGECYATDSGIAQDVIITCLDFDSVTASLRDRAQTLLTERVEASEDADAIYDENGNYREDLVMEVLRDVTLDTLEEDAKSKEQTLTVNLVYKKGQWWVVPDQALLSAISGGIAG